MNGDSYSPTTIANLIGMLRGNPGAMATVNKELPRFKIADNADDPNLNAGLASADPAIVRFLGDKLANAVYNLP